MEERSFFLLTFYWLSLEWQGCDALRGYCGGHELRANLSVHHWEEWVSCRWYTSALCVAWSEAWHCLIHGEGAASASGTQEATSADGALFMYLQSKLFMTEIEASKLESPQNDSKCVKILLFPLYKTKEQLVPSLFFEIQNFPYKLCDVQKSFNL